VSASIWTEVSALLGSACSSSRPPTGDGCWRFPWLLEKNVALYDSATGRCSRSYRSNAAPLINYMIDNMHSYMRRLAANRGARWSESKLSKIRSSLLGAVQKYVVQSACTADCRTTTWEKRWSEMGTLPNAELLEKLPARSSKTSRSCTGSMYVSR